MDNSKNRYFPLRISKKSSASNIKLLVLDAYNRTYLTVEVNKLPEGMVEQTPFNFKEYKYCDSDTIGKFDTVCVYVDYKNELYGILDFKTTKIFYWVPFEYMDSNNIVNFDKNKMYDCTEEQQLGYINEENRILKVIKFDILRINKNNITIDELLLKRGTKSVIADEEIEIDKRLKELDNAERELNNKEKELKEKEDRVNNIIATIDESIDTNKLNTIVNVVNIKSLDNSNNTEETSNNDKLSVSFYKLFVQNMKIGDRLTIPNNVFSLFSTIVKKVIDSNMQGTEYTCIAEVRLEKTSLNCIHCIIEHNGVTKITILKEESTDGIELNIVNKYYLQYLKWKKERM